VPKIQQFLFAIRIEQMDSAGPDSYFILKDLSIDPGGLWTGSANI
jgi:hypothetical protein